MNDLGLEYEFITTVISSREIPYSVQAVNALLLSHEGRILNRNASLEMSTNLTTQRINFNSGNNFQRNNQEETSMEEEDIMELVEEVEEGPQMEIGHNANSVERLGALSRNATIDLISALPEMIHHLHQATEVVILHNFKIQIPLSFKIVLILLNMGIKICKTIFP